MIFFRPRVRAPLSRPNASDAGTRDRRRARRKFFRNLTNRARTFVSRPGRTSFKPVTQSTIEIESCDFFGPRLRSLDPGRTSQTRRAATADVHRRPLETNFAWSARTHLRLPATSRPRAGRCLGRRTFAWRSEFFEAFFGFRFFGFSVFRFFGFSVFGFRFSVFRFFGFSVFNFHFTHFCDFFTKTFQLLKKSSRNDRSTPTGGHGGSTGHHGRTRQTPGPETADVLDRHPIEIFRTEHVLTFGYPRRAGQVPGDASDAALLPGGPSFSKRLSVFGFRFSVFGFRFSVFGFSVFRFSTSTSHTFATFSRKLSNF